MEEIVQIIFEFMRKNQLTLNNTPNLMPDFLHPTRIKIGNGLFAIILVEIRQYLTDTRFHIDISYELDEYLAITEKLANVLNEQAVVINKVYRVPQMTIFYIS